MNNLSAHNIAMVEHFPDNFFNKHVNEPFIQKIMASVTNYQNWIPGNPNYYEPDYFADGKAFEFTIASDSRKKNNFIQRTLSATYATDDVQSDVFSYIAERIDDKAGKRYSVDNVHLCVLCLLEMYNWVAGIYGQHFDKLLDYRRKVFFDELKATYIQSGIFKNIFIIFPDPFAKWWVYDMLSNGYDFYQLTKEEIMCGNVPFVLVKESFDNLIKDSL